jgi:lysozyme
MAVRLVTDLQSQLRLDEGEKLTAYQDSEGYWTIGIGRLIDARKSGGITPVESTYLFSNDLAKIELQIDRWAPWLRTVDEVRLGAIKNMIFQMGLRKVLMFVNALALVRAARWDDAAREFLDSAWAKQTPDRAFRIAEQIRTGTWQ